MCGLLKTTMSTDFKSLSFIGWQIWNVTKPNSYFTHIIHRLHILMRCVFSTSNEKSNEIVYFKYVLTFKLDIVWFSCIRCRHSLNAWHLIMSGVEVPWVSADFRGKEGHEGRVHMFKGVDGALGVQIVCYSSFVALVALTCDAEHNPFSQKSINIWSFPFEFHWREIWHKLHTNQQQIFAFTATCCRRTCFSWHLKMM